MAAAPVAEWKVVSAYDTKGSVEKREKEGQPEKKGEGGGENRPKDKKEVVAYIRRKLGECTKGMKKEELEELKKNALKKTEDIVLMKHDDLRYLDGYPGGMGLTDRCLAEDEANKIVFSEQQDMNKSRTPFESTLHNPFGAEDAKAGGKGKVRSFRALGDRYALYMQQEGFEGGSLSESERELLTRGVQAEHHNRQALALHQLFKACSTSILRQTSGEDNRKVAGEILGQCDKSTREKSTELLHLLQKAYENVMTIPASSEVNKVREKCDEFHSILEKVMEREEMNEDTLVVATSVYLSLRLLSENFQKCGAFCGFDKNKRFGRKEDYEEERGKPIAEVQILSGGLGGEKKVSFPEEKVAPLGQKNRRIEFMKSNMQIVGANLRITPEHDDEIGDLHDNNIPLTEYLHWGCWEVRTVCMVYRCSAHFLNIGERLMELIGKGVAKLPGCAYPNLDTLHSSLHNNGYGVLRHVPIYSNRRDREKPLRAIPLRKKASFPRLVWETPMAVNGNKVAFVKLVETDGQGGKRGDLVVSSLPRYGAPLFSVERVWDDVEGGSVDFVRLYNDLVVWVQEGNTLHWARRCPQTKEVVHFQRCISNEAGKRRISGCGFSKSGDRVWVGVSNGVLHVFNVTKEKHVLEFDNTVYALGPHPVFDAHLTPKGTYLMSNGILEYIDQRREEPRFRTYDFGDCASFDVRGRRVTFQRDDHALVYMYINNENFSMKEDPAVKKFKPGLFFPLAQCTTKHVRSFLHGTVWSVPLSAQNGKLPGWALFHTRFKGFSH